METIDDIVKEMRNGIVANSWIEQATREFVDRIEKAAKWIVEGLNDGIVERDQYIQKLTNKNERLKAALKPILAMRREDFDCGAEYAVNCGLAVDKAQIIYEEGETE